MLAGVAARMASASPAASQRWAAAATAAAAAAAPLLPIIVSVPLALRMRTQFVGRNAVTSISVVV